MRVLTNTLVSHQFNRPRLYRRRFPGRFNFWICFGHNLNYFTIYPKYHLLHHSIFDNFLNLKFQCWYLSLLSKFSNNSRNFGVHQWRIPMLLPPTSPWWFFSLRYLGFSIILYVFWITYWMSESKTLICVKKFDSIFYCFAEEREFGTNTVC